MEHWSLETVVAINKINEVLFNKLNHRASHYYSLGGVF
jgi:hypothetical protein